MATSPLKRVFSYAALSHKQRNTKTAPEFVLFHAPASEIIEWADVERLTPSTLNGAQRPLKDLRMKKVRRFFDTEERNTIPTAVIIALDSSSSNFSPVRGLTGAGKLSLSVNKIKKPGLIIDGQHRVYGAALFDPNIRLNVVAFLGGDDAERAFQFVVINNSGLKVSKDHIKALNLTYDSKKLNKRLVDSAGVALGLSDSDYDDLQVINGTAPFRGILDLPINKSGYVAANAVESALQLVRDNVRHLGIEGLERDVFLEMWSEIKQYYSTAWQAPAEDQHLLQKVSIFALTDFLLEEMRARARSDGLDYTKDGVLNSVIVGQLQRVPIEFWQSIWKAKELDTSAGRQIVRETLTSIESNVRYSRPWSDGLKIIDASLKGKTKKIPVKKTVAAKNAPVVRRKRR